MTRKKYIWKQSKHWKQTSYTYSNEINVGNIMEDKVF